ncbi:unnamed protein product [Darwinula stevensoni]|uniref:CTLH domain-containing protein n=1 Tax=Darwinula stevensoni TaxID=69355 RepID=A0A7R8WZ21_9CRUS|nr:unnamed protein product [Darwinula stevensoni]CAG0880081.1 unnamed protein product [Darwinula stevensoni]
MPGTGAHLSLKEEDVVKLSLEFLNNRDLHITQLSLERETGVINGSYSDDLLFLRQLILDGQWEDVLEFIQPLESIDGFDARKFRYIILKHKYVELLCIKSEAGQLANMESAMEEVVKVLNDLEGVCPSKEEHSNLCLLLTMSKLSDEAEFRDWNPSTARVQCFRAIYPLVEKFLVDKKPITPMSKNDRLMQLIIKGLLYESCVEYCQLKATSTNGTQAGEMQFAKLLGPNTGFSDADLSLLSWLQSIPSQTFTCPFEQKTLNVDVERLEKPSLETSWTEHMLVTPIKPKIFPYSAMPYTRPRSADIMSRSLNIILENGLPSTVMPLGMNPTRNSLMVLSVGEMSRSLASFHLSGNKKSMNTSVDKLFEDSHESVFTSNINNSNCDLPPIMERGELPRPPRRKRSKSPEKGGSPSRATSSSRRPLPPTPDDSMSPNDSPRASRDSTPSASGDLLREYQRQKQNRVGPHVQTDEVQLNGGDPGLRRSRLDGSPRRIRTNGDELQASQKPQTVQKEK